MKNFAINTTSTLMSAAVVIGALALATPAKADSGDVIKGAIGVIILNEVLNPRNNTNTNVGVTPNGDVYGGVNTQRFPQHTTIINNYPQDCGFVQNISRHPGYNIITTRDRCTGQIISERTVYTHRHRHYNNW